MSAMKHLRYVLGSLSAVMSADVSAVTFWERCSPAGTPSVSSRLASASAGSTGCCPGVCPASHP